jgi:hypothetical protein
MPCKVAKHLVENIEARAFGHRIIQVAKRQILDGGHKHRWMAFEMHDHAQRAKSFLQCGERALNAGRRSVATADMQRA